jgi:D-alanyl-D-alanine carboxypeptidase/D-alanyl-D-alanine-endopeptidase (penicillin-binding protein 4)
MNKLVELAVIESMPLSDELRILNKISQNLHAEILLRTLGAVVKGEGSDEKGLEAVAEFLREINARMKGVRLRDGSGLARVDMITPATSVDLLRFMAKHAHQDVYRASLPLAGVDGTLERRMIGTRAESNVQAKTGTLAYTITLAGYVTTAAGERLALSVMANNHTGAAGDVTRAADQICALLAEFQDKRQVPPGSARR